MTVAEVEALLKLNQQTVRNWIDTGTLPAIRIGRRVRVLRSDLHRLIESGKSSPPPALDRSAQDFWDGEPEP